MTDTPTPQLGATPSRSTLLQQVSSAHGMQSADALQAYLQQLPRPQIAICPHTNVAVHHSLDTSGIDGPWWNYVSSMRPAEEVPPTFFAFTGALRLGGPIPSLPWLVKPGPEAPYVLPRLLNLPGMRAVIRGTSIAGWPAWTITYFSDRDQAVVRVNDWGASRYWVDSGRGIEWDSAPEDVEPLDFNLAPWIDNGSLLWIADTNSDITLHTTSADCPYINLPGRQCLMRIQDGVAWEPNAIADPRMMRR